MRVLAAILLLVPLSACLGSPDAGAPPGGAAAPASLAWVEHADGPRPRVEVASAVLAGKIYVIGGFTTDGASSRAVDVYDPATDAWTAAPDYPYPLHHSFAVGVEEGQGPAGVYVFGGWGGAPTPDPVPPLPLPSALAFRLAPDGSSWTPIARMPAARGAHTGGVIDGKVYVVGGVSERLELATETWVYDPAADAWSAAPAMPTPRDHVTSAVLDGRLHVLAGQRLSHADNLAAHEAFDPETGEWVRLADVPTPRNAMVAGVVDGRIALAGGQTDVEVFAIVEVYDPANDAWQNATAMPTARHGGAAGSVGGRFFTLCGGTIAGSAADLSAAVESFGLAT